jgi:cytidyltransferase-like protein
MTKKVLVGGVFNIIHDGHVFFLKKAKALGGYLIVVVAHDRTAHKTKRYKVLDQKTRKQNIEKLGIANKVVIGDAKDFMKVVRREKPDIIVLGYDQKMGEKELRRMLAGSRIECKIKRIKESLKGYKTSKIMKNKENS